MKKIQLYILAALIVLTACEKNTFNATDQQGVEGKALVKVGLFNMTPAAMPLLIYVNGIRVSSAVSAPYPYPGGGYNTNGGTGGDYFAMNPGENKFEFYTTNPGTANIITKIFETTQSFDANQRHTVYIADTAANMVAIKAPDNGVAPTDSGFANVRFINLIPNSTGLDFYKNNTLLKSDIKYKEFTEFFNMPSGTADTFSVRPAGSAPGHALTASAYYRLAINTNKRILSFISTGYLGVPGTTDPRRPKVSVAVNQ